MQKKWTLIVVCMVLSACVPIRNAFLPYSKGDVFESLKPLYVYKTDFFGYGYSCDPNNDIDGAFLEVIPAGEQFVMSEYRYWQRSSWNTGTYDGISAKISYMSDEQEKYKFNISSYFNHTSAKEEPCLYFSQVFKEK